MKRTRLSRWLALAACAAVIAGAATAAGCSDDDKDDSGGSTPAATKPAATVATSADQKAVQQVFLDAISRWNAKDVDGLAALFTDEGLISSFGDDGASAAEVRAGLQDFVGNEDIGNPSFKQTTITGSTAKLEATFSFGAMLTRSKFDLLKVGSDWKLNSEESDLPVDVPSGTKIVHIDANEFAFGVDASAINGKFAFEFANVGKQHHELGLARIAADANIPDLLQKAMESPDGLPEGVEFVAGTDADPGDTRNMVFVEPLEPGRYLMVCFVNDESEGENGTPHALKGMYKEFTIK